MNTSKFIKWKVLKAGRGEPVLFVPGGPGIDPEYGTKIMELLNIKGPVWGAQLKTNNQSYQKLIPAWNKEITQKIKELKSPTVFAHSAGAMLLLLNEDCSSLNIKRIVLLNSPISATYLKNLPSTTKRLSKHFKKLELTKHEQAFSNSPTGLNLKRLWECWTPYYFAASNIKKGRTFIRKLKINKQVFVQGSRALSEHKYYCKWRHSRVPTVWLMGAKDNLILPKVLGELMQFKKNKSPNLTVAVAKKGGHFPWIDSPTEFKKLLRF